VRQACSNSFIIVIVYRPNVTTDGSRAVDVYRCDPLLAYSADFNLTRGGKNDEQIKKRSETFGSEPTSFDSHLILTVKQKNKKSLPDVLRRQMHRVQQDNMGGLWAAQRLRSRICSAGPMVHLCTTSTSRMGVCADVAHDVRPFRSAQAT
jgi:hypothetical protein